MDKTEDIISFNGYNLIKKDLGCVPTEQRVLINTISPNSYGLSVKDTNMDKALKGADYLILDGVYFGWWPMFVLREKATRITGWDSFVYFSKLMEHKKGRVFFLGSSEETLSKIKEKYRIDYPSVEVGYYSPPFKDEFSEEDNQKMCEQINLFAPNVLFVGMTAPKQEKWSFQHKEKLHVNVISTIGNVFDWYAGNSKRPGIFWQKIGLEWLIRIYYRPQVFKRNIANQMLFFKHLLLTIIRIK